MSAVCRLKYMIMYIDIGYRASIRVVLYIYFDKNFGLIENFFISSINVKLLTVFGTFLLFTLRNTSVRTKVLKIKPLAVARPSTPLTECRV